MGRERKGKGKRGEDKVSEGEWGERERQREGNIKREAASQKKKLEME